MPSSKSKRKPFHKRNKLLVILVIIILTAVTLYYVLQRNSVKSYIEPYVMHWKSVENSESVSCHYLDEDDALPAAEDFDFSPRPNSIFFHETSCTGGLNSRQACAIESAARAHPRRQIYVLFSAPVTEEVYTRSCLAKLKLFQNIKFARVHILDYARNTPLEEMVASKPFSKSPWSVEHTSDALRYLTLYKWGGVYLDTDMLVVKPLTPLGHNWVAKEGKSLVNAAAIAISMDHLGRRLANALINELKTTYRPDIWIHNGPGAITRVLEKLCGTPNLTEWSSKTCHGLEVYNPEYFYPVYYTQNSLYFKPGELKDLGKNAYTHHFWNKLTADMKIEKGSPYWNMAKQFCPTIFEMYGDDFGN